jgi:hypothetical protein
LTRPANSAIDIIDNVSQVQQAMMTVMVPHGLTPGQTFSWNAPDGRTMQMQVSTHHPTSRRPFRHVTATYR